MPDFTNTFLFPFLTYDWLIFISAFVIGLIIAVSKRSILLNLIITFYPIILIMTAIKATNFYSYADWVPSVAFVISFALVFSIVRSIFVENYEELNGSLLGNVLLSLAIAVLVFLVVLIVFPPVAVTPFFGAIFAEEYIFYQYAVSLALVYLGTR